jgi:hypothetical protein
LLFRIANQREFVAAIAEILVEVRASRWRGAKGLGHLGWHAEELVDAAVVKLDLQRSARLIVSNGGNGRRGNGLAIHY